MVKLEQQKAREKKLDFARIRKLEWENFAMSRSLILDMVEESLQFYDVRDCTDIVMEIIDKAVLETEPYEMMEHSGKEEGDIEPAEIMEHSGQEGREMCHIKYSPGTELELPPYVFQHLKPHCSGREVRDETSQEQPRSPLMRLRNEQTNTFSFKNVSQKMEMSSRKQKRFLEGSTGVRLFQVRSNTTILECRNGQINPTNQKTRSKRKRKYSANDNQEIKKWRGMCL